VPHAAAALAEVAHGQLREPVAAGFELHLPQLLVGPALMLVALGGDEAELLHPRGQPVAHSLELLEAE
jgi:hypothetical protein